MDHFSSKPNYSNIEIILPQVGESQLGPSGARYLEVAMTDSVCSIGPAQSRSWFQTRQATSWIDHAC
jgi:hypothetical protein